MSSSSPKQQRSDSHEAEGNERSPLLRPPPSSSSSQQPQPPSRATTTTRIEKWIANLTPSQRNRGVILILSAEVVGSSMDATARFLQQSQGRGGERSIGVFQVIFARMSITWLLSTIYLWYTKVPDFPFGAPKVRLLLFLRALFGFLGLFCLYYSVHYLTLSEATIIRFLVPLTTTILCSLLLSQAFTSRDAIAGFLALGGVVIMAHPASIFGSSPSTIHPSTIATPIDPVTPKTHIIALVASLLGVFFAASAYTCIRLIGSRAHALISVSYFSALATIFTFIVLLVHPTESIHFVIPSSARDWILLITLGTSGFILQFLLTAGLQMDKSSRATSMLYLQVVFAAAYDWGIWGVLPGGWDWIGGGVVVASTLWLALGKVSEKKAEEGGKARDNEERGLLTDNEETEEEDVGENVGGVRRGSVSA